MKRKTKGLLCLTVASFALLLGACGPKGDGSNNANSAKSTKITSALPKIEITDANGKKSASVIIGNSITLTANQEGVTWSTTDANVATVNNGVVTAVATGTATIKASKEGFKDGTFSVEVTRKPADATLHFETDSDHYSADGWWENNGRGPGATPVYSKSSASDGTCIAYFGEGDKETVTFTSSAAVQAELVISMGHNDSFESLATIMTAKFNGTDIDLTNVAFTSDSDGSGNYSFFDVSFGNVTLKTGENNVLEIGMLGNAPYLDDLKIYCASAATINAVTPPAKETIAITNPESDLTIIQGDKVTLTSATTGLKFMSQNESVATVDENTGEVTGVSVGTANIIARKEGMISTRVTITVNERVVDGTIVVEAETGTCNGAAVGDDNDKCHIKTSSGGNTYLLDWEQGATVVIKFNAAKAGTYTMGWQARNSSYGSSATPIDVATNMSCKMNNNAVTLSGEISGYTFIVFEVGEVTLKDGENTIEITNVSGAPHLDLLKFVPKA